MIDIIMPRLRQGKFVLIAEIGVNYYDVAIKLHISLMDAAKFMILSACNSGVQAVKFQTYKAESLVVENSPSYWDRTEEPAKSQFELFHKFDRFGADEYRELAAFCERIGIEFCSTPFDLVSADYLDPLMNVYKISSSDLSNLPFIAYIAKKGKPVLLSVGASNSEEIHAAVKTIRHYNDKDLVLLHCVLEYPTPYEHACLAKITALHEAFPDAYIGYSDHTKPDDSADVIKSAYLLGAQLVEKHFTTDKALRGNDHYHAMDPHDAERILQSIAFMDMLKGKGSLKSMPGEAAARRNARRSLVAACNIEAGETVTEEMLTWKRPGTGISPSEINVVVGCKARRKISADEIMQWDMLERNGQ